ncbi:hypothetical protein GCM10007981_14010 [Thermocladium modestius]|uniref:Uncharacterized protein n=1 Tax=Thermocladium modestius TaxID=62609 RepID=A0A830GUU3_9CREN|nr:hypothetical protein GCM10007981_14010 [Thermocladium modestius]
MVIHYKGSPSKAGPYHEWLNGERLTGFLVENEIARTTDLSRPKGETWFLFCKIYRG